MPSPDVVFVTYQEPNAEEHFARLLAFAPRAKRVRDVEGMYNAYQQAARIAETPFFFLVDGDSWILDGFAFSAPIDASRAEVWMWLAKNAVNGLQHLNGSVKLVSREAMLSMNPAALDYSASIRGRRRVIEEVASETRFNASPFLAWRAGFRECAKLAGGLVNHPSVPRLLQVWQTVGKYKPNGTWCMLGAKMGAAYGEKWRGTDAMRAINDMAWQRTEFERVQASADHTPSPQK